MTGLTNEQVQQRIEEGKINVNENPNTRSYKQIVRENVLTFFNFLNLALMIMVLLVGSYKNSMFMGIIVINTVIGIIQEVRAKKTLDKLAILTESKAVVLREGKKWSISTEKLVLDDILFLKTGDQVPADARVLEGSIEVNESLLTGESDNLQKNEGDELFSGSFVTSGEACCQVIHVGKDNYASQITSEAKEFKRHNSELRNSLNAILKIISVIIVPMGMLLFYKQYYIAGNGIRDAVVNMVAAVLGMIPEGLVLLTSVALTLGALTLTRKNTLVQELYCIETLARVDTLCLDKTGTITAGTMCVEQVQPYVEGMEIKAPEAENENISESTINGTSILNNDRNKNILENIHTGNTQTTAEDEIIIVTDDNTKANLDGTYSIYKDGVLQGTLDMNEDGTFSFISEEGITGEVTFDYVIKTSINQNHETSFVISNTSKVTLKILERQKINITGTKTWNDDNDRDGKRPDSITVILRAGNKEIQRKIVTKDNNWSYTFENLYKYEKGHENDSEYEISYTVEEQKVEGYTTSVDNNNNITNTHEIEKTQVVGKKSWVDSNDKDGLRPESIKIILKANGKEVASKVISASDKGDNSNEWIYSFTDLDMYKDGEKIIYTVDEEVDSKTKEHYTKSYDENNKNIIVNTHNPKDVTVKGTKTWDDNNNQDGKRLDEITVNLKGMIGDEVVVEKSTKVSEYTNWTFSFKGLPEYSKGKLINYTISENAVKDYNTSIVYDAAKDSYEITNTHTPETINISGTKTWEDKDNQDGIRPESITITLYDHLGKEVGETTATEKTNWTYTFDNLPKYANGKEIKYTVKETSQINGYETIVKDFDITNRHTPETVSYKVTKVWNDNNNQDGIRPDSITVRIVGVITKDGTVKVVLTKEQKISAANNWTYTFKDLPKYNKGEPVIYEIVEDVVKGYTSNVSQDKEKYNGTITNTHKVAKKNIKVTKTWKDNNNKINKRPESITVNVLKNGEFFKQIILTKDMNWMFILNNLDKFENGKEIIYTIEELKVKGYTTTYNGYNIINTLINKRSSNKVIPVIKGKVEITPPSTGIESNNDINLLEGLLITFLLVGTVVTPIRLIKNN